MMYYKHKTKNRINTPLPLIAYENNRAHTKIHDEVISFLVYSIYKISKLINYDHSKSIVRRSNIPLHLKQGKQKVRKYDISFIYKDHIVFIEVKTIKLGGKGDGKNSKMAHTERNKRKD